jgi:ribulose-phosphate 3-epimerase
MREIIPGILEKNLSEIKNKLTFLRGRVGCVQIDFCDGNFVRNQTWPFAFGGFNDYDFRKIINEEEGMPFWNDFDFEFDLMVRDAVENFDLYMKLGPKRVIFHLGSERSIREFEHFLDGLDLYTRDNIEIGLAFNPDEDLSVVSRLSYKVDFLQCMGINNIGFQNEKFNEKVLENIKYLKDKLQGVVISVDGGVNMENIETLIKSGVDRVVVGSAIWKNGDPVGALQAFQDLI